MGRVEDVKDHPIIFSGPMVRALLAGQKSMTRRLAWKEGPPKTIKGRAMTGFRRASPWQHVKPNDRLWVRETFACDIEEIPPLDYHDIMKVRDIIYYAATNGTWPGRWRSPIHMPRTVSRLTLIVTAAKIEPLQEISEGDAEAEGVNAINMLDVKRQAAWSARDDFAQLWNKLHGPDAWAANPEVVAITFAVHKTNIDAMPKSEAA